MDKTIYGLWVEAVEEPPGVPEAWHEGKDENDPARMQLALRFNLSEAIAERNAFNCACKGHDLRLLFMQGHDLASARRISVGTLRRSSASAV